MPIVRRRRLVADVFCLLQIRVYPLGGIRAGEADEGPVRAAFIHRLPSKISSVAWDPFDEVSVPIFCVWEASLAMR